MLTVRRKTMLWTSVLLVVSLALVYELARRIFLEEMTLLGQDYAERRAVVAANVLNSSLDEVERLAYDSGAWDATYEFVEGQRPEYVKENTTDQSFRGLRINLLVILNSSGRPVLARLLDYDSNRDRPIPPDFMSLLKRYAAPEGFHAEPRSSSGLLEYGANIYLVAAHPIIPSDEQGEPRGTLIMARLFDGGEQKRLEKIIQQEFALRHLEDPSVGPDIAKALLDSREPQPVVTRVMDERTVLGFALLRDVFGEPKFAAEVTWRRVFYAQGRRLLYYFVFAFMAVGFGLIASVLVLLGRLVLNPFSRLSAQVARLGERGDLFRRIDMEGGEEMNNLARAINKMLDDLQRAQEEIRRSDQQFRAIVDHQLELICRFGVDGHLTFVNNAFCRFFGQGAENLIGRSFMPLTAPEDQALVQRELISLSPVRTVGTLESRVKLSSGQVRWVHWTIRAFLSETGAEISGFQSVGHDITERKEVEETLRRRVAMEELVSGISTDFLSLPDAGIEDGMVRALRRVGEFTRGDRCYVRLLSEDRSRIQLAYEWYAEGLQPRPYDVRTLAASAFPWMAARLTHLEVVRVNRLEDLPAEAAGELEIWRQVGVRSILAAPLVLNDQMVGFVGLAAEKNHRTWTDEDSCLLKLVGNVFVSFLGRKRAENVLR